VALLKGSLLRNYAYSLMQMLAPHVPQKVLTGARPMPPGEQSGLFCRAGGPAFRLGRRAPVGCRLGQFSSGSVSMEMLGVP
jgi:hypothetical protein